MALVSIPDFVTLGQRIREARDRVGLTQADVAREAALDRTALTKIESGARRVTALELARIAEALGTRMVTFFEEPTPAVVSHRSNQGLDTADSHVDLALANLVVEVEFVQSLSSNLAALELPSSVDWPRPTDSAAAELLAERARELLGLAPGEPAHGLADKVQALGLWAFSRDLGPNTADAGTVMLRSGGVSLVNSHNKVGRRRLALAHELGHYLLQDEYTVDWRVADGLGIESRLDDFARALLLPASGLRRMWSGERGDAALRERAIIAASHFQVDMSTLARRVADLGLEGDLKEIRQVRPGRSDFIEFGLLPEPVELSGTSLPIEYQRAVLKLYRAEKIGADRALELLQETYTEQDLPARHKRSENDIWQYIS